jgi:hypothetical protein
MPSVAPEKRKKNRAPHTEKRLKPRVPIEDVTVEVYASDGSPAKPEVCDIINLSEGGLLFRCLHEYDPSQQVRLTFVVPGTLVIVRTDALVMHTYHDSTGKYVGARFARLDVTERNSIDRFVRWRQNN